MIVDLPSSTTSAVNRKLVELREKGGVLAQGRVLTLVIMTDDGSAIESAIGAANEASREHPCRVIVLARGQRKAAARLDAQIRVGGDAGASDVIVLRGYGPLGEPEPSAGMVMPLLLPDAPVVAWWPQQCPVAPSKSDIGKMAQRRITDAAAQSDPAAFVRELGENHAPGDTDFAWTRLTRWREQLAAVLDQPPFEPVTAVEVHGASDSPSTALLAAWLRLKLDAPVTWRYDDDWASGIKSVRLERSSGPTLLERQSPDVALLTQPGQPSHDLAFPRRTLRECLAEELRRLDPDVLYGRVITEGVELLDLPATQESNG